MKWWSEDRKSRVIAHSRAVFVWCLDLIYPRYCIGCTREGVVICTKCTTGLRVHSGLLEVPPLEGSDAVLRVHVGYDYGDRLVEKMVHDLKYKGVKDLGEMMGGLLAQRIKDRVGEVFLGQQWIVVPIPLHPHREIERGFNQSGLIGENLGHGLEQKYRVGILRRARATSAQAKLSRAERLKNVEGVFEVVPKWQTALLGKSVLLVDDVCTTGATLQSAAGVLRASGCGRVEAAVFAHHLSVGLLPD